MEMSFVSELVTGGKESNLEEVPDVEPNPEFSLSYDGTKQIYSQRNVSYGREISSYKRSCNIFFPKTDKKLLPILFFIHGGSWMRGDRNYRWYDAYSATGITFATQGYCAVVPSYRLSPEVKHPVHAEDLADCLLWMSKNIVNYKGDINNVHILGHSAGAHLGISSSISHSRILFTF
jgi:acetyl esterase/lipase